MTIELEGKEGIAKALGKIVGGLYIVNCKNGGEDCGFLASWLQQASFEPPEITMAINKKREFYLNDLKENKHFTINVMGTANGKSMSPFFKHEEGKSPYDGLDTKDSKNGIKILQDSVAFLECEFKGFLEAGDHYIVHAEVIGGNMIQTETEPKAHYRENGFDY